MRKVLYHISSVLENLTSVYIAIGVCAVIGFVCFFLDITSANYTFGRYVSLFISYVWLFIGIHFIFTGVRSVIKTRAFKWVDWLRVILTFILVIVLTTGIVSTGMEQLNHWVLSTWFSGQSDVRKVWLSMIIYLWAFIVLCFIGESIFPNDGYDDTSTVDSIVYKYADISSKTYVDLSICDAIALKYGGR